jgi:hypothetical protein
LLELANDSIFLLRIVLCSKYLDNFSDICPAEETDNDIPVNTDVLKLFDSENEMEQSFSGFEKEQCKCDFLELTEMNGLFLNVQLHVAFVTKKHGIPVSYIYILSVLPV